MDQYLHWDSSHFITTKNGVFSTLAFMAKVVCSNQHTLQEEMDHIRKALLACNFPSLALNSLHSKFNHKHNIHNIQMIRGNQHNNSNNKGSSKHPKHFHHSTLYKSIKFKKSCNSLGIQVHFKGNNTIRTLLMAPEDKDNKYQKSGVIYHFKLPHMNWPEEYMGESSRSFGDRLKEHCKAPSPIHHNSYTTGHLANPECFTIVDRESRGLPGI